MPTYEFICLKCKKKFERSQRMSDVPLKKCVYCNGKVERQIGAGAGLIFKGTGFYITDYKKSKPTPSTPKKETMPVSSKPAESPSKEKKKE